MRRLAVALLGALALSGCGGDDEKPPQSSRSPREAERCLRADGFKVRLATIDTRADEDAPDHTVFLADHAAEVAFYRSSARARELLPDVRASTDRVGGVLDEGGLAAIFWTREPEDSIRKRVWRCVFAG